MSTIMESVMRNSPPGSLAHILTPSCNRGFSSCFVNATIADHFKQPNPNPNVSCQRQYTVAVH